MTREQLAKRLGIARNSVYKLEMDEVASRVTLARLQRAANAFDCELVYALVPRTSLADTVHRQAIKQAKRKFDRVNASQALEASAVASAVLSRQVEDLATELVVDRPSTLWDD